MTSVPTSAPTLLIVTSTFPIELSDGSPRFVLDLAQALAAHMPVTVLAPHAPSASIRERWGDVDVRRFRYFWPTSLQRLAYGSGMRENMRASVLAVLQAPLLLVFEWRAIRRMVRVEGFEIVNSHWIVPGGLTVALARGKRGSFRHVLHVHAAGVYLLRRLPFGSRIARFVVKRSDKVLAAGSHVRDALDELLGWASGAAIQPMGVWIDQFRAGDQVPNNASALQVVLFVGRLVEKKGVLYLLRAMPIVLQRHPAARLVVGGAGPLEQSLRSEVDRLGLVQNVQFLGPLTHVEVVRRFQSCRVAVVPSVVDEHGETEGMPTVVVEAMAAGARVVGSDVAGIPDVVRHGENGWLARPKDPAHLATQIIAALDNRDTLVVEEAKATALERDWPKIAENYLMAMDIQL